MMHENWPRTDGSPGCRCPRCRSRARLIDRLADQSLSVALRHAQGRFEGEVGLEAETPAGEIKLPGRFNGWRNAITLDVLFGPNPPGEFKQKSSRVTGTGYLYRIYEQLEPRPLYIGMAYSNTIRARVASHFKRVITKKGALWQTSQVTKLAATTPADFDRMLSEVAKLRILVAQLGGAARTVRIQYATVNPTPGYQMDPKLLHAFEAALQVLENPKSYVGSSRSFEDVF